MNPFRPIRATVRPFSRPSARPTYEPVPTDRASVRLVRPADRPFNRLGFWISPGFWILASGFWMLAGFSESNTQSPESQIQAKFHIQRIQRIQAKSRGPWILWIWDFAWIWGFGVWILDFGWVLKIQYLEPRIQNPCKIHTESRKIGWQ